MLLIGLAILILSALAIVFGPGATALLPVLWGMAGAVAVVDFVLSARRNRGLELSPGGEVFIGETAELWMHLAPAPPGVQGRIDWPEGMTGPTAFDFTSNADGSGQARIVVTAVRRGVWRVEKIWLSWPSRLGLFEFVPALNTEWEMRVVPNIRQVSSGEISTKVASALYGVKENLAVGEGSEFRQLRDFVPGMDVKTIDWKRSARARSLVAKELQAERNHHVIIALDNGYLMGEEIDGIPKIDHAVTAALATSWAAIIGGDLIGYFSYDIRPRSFVAPNGGRSAFARMRSWTADLDYVARETNHTLALSSLNARIKKRSLIIILTDFIDTTSAELLIENVGILAKRHLVVFVAIRDTTIDAFVEDRPADMDGVAMLVAANQSITERRLVLQRLGRMGVTVIDAKPEAVTGRLLSTYLDIKARELI